MRSVGFTQLMKGNHQIGGDGCFGRVDDASGFAPRQKLGILCDVFHQCEALLRAVR